MALDPSALGAEGGGLMAGGAIGMGAGLLANNIGKPQYGAPSLDASSQQTMTNQYGMASQTPGQISASQVNPAMAAGKQAAGSIQDTATRQATALGMADPSSAVSAINSRLMRNLQGELGSMALKYDNQAQIESAQRLSQSIQSGLEDAQMQNAISMNRLQSYQNQLIARQQIISAISGGGVQMLGGGAMMAASRRRGSSMGTGASDLPTTANGTDVSQIG